MCVCVWKWGEGRCASLSALLLKHRTTDPNFHMMNFVVADIVKIRCHENFRVCDRGSRSVIWQANLLIY